jgi:hypothetical protein
MRNFEYYDARSQDVKLDDITSSSRNAQVLRDLRGGETAWKGAHLHVWELDVVRELYPYEDSDDDDFDYINSDGDQVRKFFVRDGDDLGWLGYFMRNVQVKDLSIYTTPECGERVHEMMNGINNNRLIERIFIRGIHADYFIESLTSIIINSSNLKTLEVYYSDDIGCSLALALTKRRNKSTLTHFHLVGNGLSNEELIEITTALREYSNLECLDVHEGLGGRDSNYYDTLAPIIDLKSITCSSRNAEILRRLRDGVPGCGEEEGVLYVVNYDCDDENHFIATERDDWGWLGYFIGNNDELHTLNLYCLPEEGYEIDAFMEGFKLNRSIENLEIRVSDIQGDDIIDGLSTFMLNTRILRRLQLWYFDIGLECARRLALALDQRPDKSSLTRFGLSQNNLGDEGLAEIATVLCAYSRLCSFYVMKNSIGSVGCESLGSLFGSRANSYDLKELILTENAIDDAGLQTLVTGLVPSCVGLKQLYLSGNQAITALGLTCLAGIFQAGSCCLETIYLDDMRIGDDGSEALAFGLTGNTSLKHLVISPSSAGITATGWFTFSKLLCDTSSINSTYLSNHTLEHIGDNYHYGRSGLDGLKVLYSDEYEPFRGIPLYVGKHILENRAPPRDAARFKIFAHHPDMNVETLFEYGLKLLPRVVSGFEWTREYSCNNEYWDWEDEDSYFYFDLRRLSSVYKFIRGMPLLVADGYWSSKWGNCQRCGRKRKFLELE